MKPKRIPVNRDDRVPPTPETVAKLIPDQVQVLFDKGLIDSDHTGAAAEIRSIYFAVVGSLFCRGRDYRVFGRGKGEIPEAIAIKYRDRYKPWAKAMGMNLPLLIDALIDGRTIPDQMLIDGLDAYIRYCKPVRHTIAQENRLTFNG